MNYGPHAIRWTGACWPRNYKSLCFSWPCFSGPQLHVVLVTIWHSWQNGTFPARCLPRGMNAILPFLDNFFWTMGDHLSPYVLQLRLLFRNHPDLYEEFEKFRPSAPIKHTTNNIWPWVFVCAVPLVAVSLIPAFGNPVLWFVQQTIGEKLAAWFKHQSVHTYICSWPPIICSHHNRIDSLYIYVYS